ncbi:Inner membrane protein YjeH [Vibrio mangrovi]|nr:Inner membrane protein YjeH [Vibrio mangrovi]
MIPAIAAGIADRMTLWAWLFLFIAVCPIALTFAGLGKRYPNAGGTAYFVRMAFNPRLERSVAWLFISVIPVGIPAAITMAGGFLQQLLPSPLNTSLWAQSITLCLLVLVNLSGSKTSGRLQSLIALSIFSLVAALLWKGQIAPQDFTMPPLTSTSLWPVASALGVMFWCFVGIEAFAHMGEEFKRPGRDFPLAILLGCLIAGLTYWACSVVILKFGAYGTPEFDVTSIPWLSDHLFGTQVSALITLVGFCACFASLNLYLQSFSRMLWAQTKQSRPQSRIARLSARGIPANATLLIAAVIYLLILLGEFARLDLSLFLKLANSVFVFIYLLAMLSAWKLLHGMARYLAGIALILCVLVFFCLGWSAMYALIIFIVLGFFPGRRTDPLQQHAT